MISLKAEPRDQVDFMNTNNNIILAAAIVKFLDAQVADNPRNMSNDALEGLKGMF